MSFHHPYLPRRQAISVKVGNITVGGDSPIVVQSMTNTDTADEIGTAIQIAELAASGSEMVRITVNTLEAAQAVPGIKARLKHMGIDVPIVGDFHFNGHKLLTQCPECVEALVKYRHNPDNVSRVNTRE